MADNNQLIQTRQNASILKWQAEISSLPEREQTRLQRAWSRWGRVFYEKDNPDCVVAKFPSMNKDSIFPTLDSAILSSSPTMPFCDRCWGPDASVEWIKVQLTEVMLFIGLREKVGAYQIKALAQQIRTMCVSNCVTMAELMVFFSKFEKGEYDTFKGYERPNPQVITKSFQDFLDDLYYEREYVAEQKRKQREVIDFEEQRRNAVPPPKESVELLGRLMSEHPSMRKKEHIPKDNRESLLWMIEKDGELSKAMTFEELTEYTKQFNECDYKIIRFDKKQQ